jgi:hypothetical protein
MRLLSSSSLVIRLSRVIPVPLTSLGLLALGGCASSLANQDRVVVAVDTSPAMSNERPIEISEPVPATEAPAPPPNRRLSHTVTLGQGTTEGYTPMPAPENQGNGGGPNIIVNNNVTVVGGTPAYGGYYGGYGYGYGGGGYGGTARGGYGEGRSNGNTTYGGAASTGTHQAWAPTGWEGAQRTASPGQTPAIGGNYSRAPNSGPAPMR